MKLYFAYGSNMWDEQMNSRCPDSRKIGISILPGYRWIIIKRGFANVVEAQGSEVEGVLFEISPSDEKSLDCKEGVAKGLYQKIELLVQHEGEEKLALIYIDPVKEEGEPSDEYVDRINRGLADAKLSDAYVEVQIRKFIHE